MAPTLDDDKLELVVSVPVENSPSNKRQMCDRSENN